MNAPIATLGKLTVAFETVTPAMAYEWLKKNPHNRHMREDVITSYARDMKSGNWHTTHQGIAFNESGELIDGQHRLAAIIKANLSIVMLVVRGLPVQPQDKQSKTMDVVDRGATRSLADILHLQHGYAAKDAKTVVSTATAVARICLFAHDSARTMRLRKMTVPLVLAILDRYSETILIAVTNRAEQWGLKHSVLLGSIAFAANAQPKLTGQFYRKLVEGDNLGKTSPVLHLRNWLQSDEFRALHGHSMEAKASFGIILTAVMQFIQGKSVDRLTRAPDVVPFFAKQQQDDVTAISALFL